EAIAEFGEVVRRDPQNLRAQIGLGETYLRAGDLDRAATHLEAAVGTGRPVTRAWNSLGEVYARRGDAARATGAWKKSLAIDPAQPEIRKRLSGSGG
ncbi:MAG TPA: tetratricopeptide repeat protein, partial [Dongiaceae bacterium]|nr:tetratricopeptide repeat protein [Dongiaceae bacterium]